MPLLGFVEEVLERRALLQSVAGEGYERALKGIALREGPALGIEIPPGMRDAIVAAGLLRPETWSALQAHYCGAMPAMLAAQLRRAGGVEERLFDARLDLARLPRLREGLHALFALVSRAGLPCEELLGAATPEALAQGRSLGELYTKCHFGRSMPMLYAYPGDLAAERSPLEWIDARFVGPLVHELSHFRAAEPPAPANLHEALAAYIGSEAWPAQVWPADGEEDALPGGAWFAAVGGWLARAVGFEGALRVQAGALDLRDALGSRCAEALRVYGFLHFLETGAPHLLSDAFHPERWWKLIDLHRDPALAEDFARGFVEPVLQGAPPLQRSWDSWLDALRWQDLPSWRDAPGEIDGKLALRAEHALQVRAERRGMTFHARRAEPPPFGSTTKRTVDLQLDRDACMLRANWPGPDAVGAPPAHPYPPALCRE